MKLEEAKKLQNIFKSHRNEILRGRNKSEEQRVALENIKLLYESREAVIKLFNNYFSIVSEAKYKAIHGKGILKMLAHVARVAEASDHSNIKILSPKQILQRLIIALGQVQTGNTYENLLNEIRQIIHSLYREKEITKNVNNNIMVSIKLKNRMDTIFMNSRNSKTSDPRRLLLNLSDKINLKRSDKYVALSNLNIYYIWKQ